MYRYYYKIIDCLYIFTIGKKYWMYLPGTFYYLEVSLKLVPTYVTVTVNLNFYLLDWF